MWRLRHGLSQSVVFLILPLFREDRGAYLECIDPYVLRYRMGVSVEYRQSIVSTALTDPHGTLLPNCQDLSPRSFLVDKRTLLVYIFKTLVASILLWWTAKGVRAVPAMDWRPDRFSVTTPPE